MAMDDSGEWWTGSEASDIGPYLAEYTLCGGGYPANAFWPVVCTCGSAQFRLLRARSITQRTCAGCGQVRYISRSGDGGGWEEAAWEEKPEPCTCVGCGGDTVNVCLGLADYARHPGCANRPGSPLPDAVLWFYVGYRCVKCGILGCFNDGKVGRCPMAESTFREIAGELPHKSGQA